MDENVRASLDDHRDPIPADALAFLGIAEAARRMRTGELSPVELTDAYLARIAAIDGQLNAYITVTAELAREQAHVAQVEMARGAWRGPLHGIPFGLKDMFETRGVRTTAHSRVLAHHVPAHDASTVTRLYAAGAVLLGKHALHEFAHGGPSFDLPWPPARNPWNTAHYTGSSSTGSGAAVAGGLAAFALGTDTGGSVRTPAWLCGIVGLKPTFGLVGRSGVIPFSASCDHVGPLARTVEDAALVLPAIAGHDAGDPGSYAGDVPDFTRDLRAGIAGLRIGVLRHHWEEDIRPNPELRQAVDDALAVLRDLGAHVDDVRVRSLHEYYAVRIMLTESELFARHQHHLAQHAADYGHHFLGRALAATLFSSADYLAAQRERRRIIEEMQPIYRRFDALVTAGSGPAAHLDAHRSIGAAQKWSTPSMGTMFSVTGAPALALPCGFSASGLPLGLQIAGRPFADATVLRIGHAYEQATRWFERHPHLTPGAAPAAIDTRTEAVAAADLDPAVLEHVRVAVRHAGLALDATQLALLCESAPHALMMARRLRRDLDPAAETAAVFSLQP
jgi:aspartyl-tRNA(Asn)/glutamyl-tRNA(Gln) amidotransferase subunit A